MKKFKRAAAAIMAMVMTAASVPHVNAEEYLSVLTF